MEGAGLPGQRWCSRAEGKSWGPGAMRRGGGVGTAGIREQKARGGGATVVTSSWGWPLRKGAEREWGDSLQQRQPRRLPLDSVQFSRSVVSNSSQPHGPQHARPPCPSPTPGVYPDSVRRVSDATQPSHPLSSPSPLAPNPSQPQSLFQ